MNILSSDPNTLLCPKCSLWYDPVSSIPHTCVGRTSNERFMGFLAHYGFDYKDTNGYTLAKCFRISREDAVRLFEAMESWRRAPELITKNNARTYQALAAEARQLLGDVYNHGENSELHRRIQQFLGCGERRRGT